MELIIKLCKEKRDEIINEAVNNFLGLSDFKVRKHIRGDESVNGDLYKQFKSEVVFPEWYLDEVFGSKYAKHFGLTKENCRIIN